MLLLLPLSFAVKVISSKHFLPCHAHLKNSRTVQGNNHQKPFFSLSPEFVCPSSTLRSACSFKRTSLYGRSSNNPLLHYPRYVMYSILSVIGTHDFYFYLQLIYVSELNQGQDKTLNFESANLNIAYM